MTSRWEGLYGRNPRDCVARRPFLLLSNTLSSPMPGDAGDHKGPPRHTSATLAPTDVDELFVSTTISAPNSISRYPYRLDELDLLALTMQYCGKLIQGSIQIS